MVGVLIFPSGYNGSKTVTSPFVAFSSFWAKRAEERLTPLLILKSVSI